MLQGLVGPTGAAGASRDETLLLGCKNTCFISVRRFSWRPIENHWLISLNLEIGFWNSCVCASDATSEVDTSHPTRRLLQERLLIGSEVSTQNDDKARTSKADLPQLPSVVDTDVSSHVDDASTDYQQPVAFPPQLPSVVNSDVSTHADDVISDERTDCRHVHNDEFDTGLDETVYHDCFSASFAG